MCTNAGEGDLFPEKAEKLSDNIGERTCMKCDQKAVLAIRINDPLCRDCFLSYCTHKFRSSFGKSKLVRDQEKVLVAYSGGKGSCAMIHLIQEGLSKRAQKKLRFIPSLLFIDDGAVHGKSRMQRSKLNTTMIHQMKKTGLQCYVYSLEQVLTLESSTSAAGKSVNCCDLNEVEDLAGFLNDLSLRSEEQETQLQKLLSTVKSQTAKDNLLFVLRQQLLVQIARELKYSKVFVEDTATRLSIRLLSNITQGRGSHLPYETGFADPRYGDITLIRPMREFSSKEVDMYCTFNNLEAPSTDTFGQKEADVVGLDRLTEEFVLGLQAEYPNTVSTIFRTGEKLDSSAFNNENQDDLCSLCHAPRDTDVGNSSALNATQLSQNLAQTMKARNVAGGLAESSTDIQSLGTTNSCGGDVCTADTTECCGQGDGSCSSSKIRKLAKEEMIPMLCYGCRLLVKDCDDVTSLPKTVLDDVTRQINRKEMKASIQDYLLDDQ